MFASVLGFLLGVITAYIVWYGAIAAVKLVQRRFFSAPDKWAELESDHTEESLVALTEVDVELLQGWGWEAPAEVERHVSDLRLQRRQEEAEKRRAERAARPHVEMTPEELEEYKRRPLAERQAEANANITGDPTVYGRE